MSNPFRQEMVPFHFFGHICLQPQFQLPLFPPLLFPIPFGVGAMHEI